MARRHVIVVLACPGALHPAGGGLEVYAFLKHGYIVSTYILVYTYLHNTINIYVLSLQYKIVYHRCKHPKIIYNGSHKTKTIVGKGDSVSQLNLILLNIKQSLRSTINTLRFLPTISFTPLSLNP